MLAFRVVKDWKKSFLRKRDLYAIIRAAMTAGADLWHREFRPKHFTHEGAAQYGYEPRSATYNFYKRRPPPKGRGHTLPLVYSGETRTRAAIHSVRNIGVSSVRRVIDAPTLNRRPKGKMQPMREEMTRVTPWERNRIAKAVDEAFQRLIDADRVRMSEDFR